MAKGIYVGVGGTARKVKKMFVGVSGVARKVKKVYVGVSGVPKLVYSAEFGYAGTTTPLTSTVQFMGVTDVGNYALFAASNVADVYNGSLVKSTASISAETLREINAGRNDNYAIFAGGTNGSGSWLSSVNAINSSLVRTSATALSTAKRFLLSGRVSQYALFFGHDSNMDAYASNLVRTTKSMSGTMDRGSSASTNAGNYAIFAGGGSSSSPSAGVTAIDPSLIVSYPTSLENARTSCVGASVGGRALVAGGVTGYMYYYNTVSHVEAFDSSLIRSTLASLSSDSRGLVGSTVDGYAVFSGGQSESYSNPMPTLHDFVDIYDESLVKTSMKMSTVRSNHYGAVAGNYLLLGGENTVYAPDAFEF